MTNLVAEIVVTLTLVTNWTGLNHGTNELGYVATKHTATVTYEGEPHEFELKTVPSNIAVWRPNQNQILKWDGGTNLLWRSIVITNNAIFTNNAIWHVNPHDNYLFQTNLNVENFP